MKVSQAVINKLNKLQKDPRFHPYTCARNLKECEVNSELNSNSSDGVLIATKNGWVCPCGKYKQEIKP